MSTSDDWADRQRAQADGFEGRLSYSSQACH
jgi:hypothetical protein